MRFRAALSIVTFFSVFAFLTVPSPRTLAAAQKDILGYYTVYYSTDKNSYHSLSSCGSCLNQISTLTFQMDSSGNIAGSTPTDGLSLANSKGILPFAAISNQTKSGFDSSIAHSILSDAAIRQTAVTNILTLLKNNNFKGVNIDFENMLASDRAVFSQFIADLSHTLRADGYLTIVSVMAKTSDSPASSWVGTFDYHALGQAADRIQIMTYDENGPWGSPGPVAGYPWVEKVIQYAVSQIPPHKILLGLPAYGYDWNTTTNSGNQAVTWKDIPALLSSTGATPQWNATEQSPYFTYKAQDGFSHTVWYENTDSITAKTRLVNTYHLAGVSMWRLGLEDENFWKAVQAGLQTANPTPVVSYDTITNASTSKSSDRAGETDFMLLRSLRTPNVFPNYPPVECDSHQDSDE